MINLYHKQTGLSLIELMVAITLSLILTLGVIQIFSSSTQTSRVQNELARIQENARFALDILSKDIRMAGQLGCNSTPLITNNTGELRAFGSGVFGYNYANPMTVSLTTDNSDPNPTADTIIENTDAIIVMSASSVSIAATSTDEAVTVNDASDISGTDPGDPMVISDCENADLFIAGTISDNSINIGTSTFSKAYDAPARLAKLNYNAYYLREHNGQRNLYRSYVNGESSSTSVDTNPLLEGVEDMQILYGEDLTNDGNANRYVDAATADMSNVVSVRIYLLLATLEDNLASEPQSYWHLDVNGCDGADSNTVTLCDPADDRRLYRGFTTTVQLRNQGIGI